MVRSRLVTGRGGDAFVGEAAQMFQACRSVDELCNVAQSRLKSLSPDLSGGLYLTSTAGEYLEQAMAWGAADGLEDIFASADCWALRCGRPHQVGSGDDLVACSHSAAEQSAWHLCLPLMAQGETLGLLYFCLATTGKQTRARRALTSNDRLLLYLNFSETLALALANIRLRETLHEQAIRDPLTGLFNRRYLQETLRRELHRSARANQPLSIVSIDIDQFKRFNDTFGHDAGDVVLKTVGEILSSRTRAGDVACRYGGEEFALVFPGMPEDVAIERAEALRHEVEMRDIHHLGKKLDQVTISAGIAVSPTHALDMESLIHAADQALYQSKTNGRNRLSVAIMPRRRTDEPARKPDEPAVKLVHSATPPPQSEVKQAVSTNTP